MKLFPISADRASLALTETGGHLSDVVFTVDGGRKVSPMHTAPWANETLPADTWEILRVLRGDFFCAPFGSSDLIPGETRVHGLPANGTWRVTGSKPGSIDAVLDGTVLGATVAKRVEVRPGESVVYQRHVMTGGSGRLPVGHHAMLRAERPLLLSFAPWTMALTPPDPVETPPGGRPLLANDQTIADLTHARRADGGTVDLTVYPTPDGFESIWMLVADRTPAFGWVTATSPDENWVWFSLKNPRILPQTLFWLSNGGRDYPPWNGRHKCAIGIEEICGYFHVGHAASIGENPVAAAGSPTAVTLTPGSAVTVSYIFGLAATPPGFGRVKDVVAAPGGIRLTDAGDRETFAACDLSFLAAG
ncbi:MAG: hypothetical protein ABI399_08105 [Bauldia sp.]